MVTFFQSPNGKTIAVKSPASLSKTDVSKLVWLFGNASALASEKLEGAFIGPRKEMITPWSTNAVEITQNMGITGIERIEEFEKTSHEKPNFDPMLKALYHGLDQDIFTINKKPEPVLFIDDIAAYNQKEGLALSTDEVDYLKGLSQKLNRKLTDSEVFGFSQVNSEHCRHKIFNGTFVIDGQEKPDTLFQLIKKPLTLTQTLWYRPIKTIAPLCKGQPWNNLRQKHKIKPTFLRFPITNRFTR